MQRVNSSAHSTQQIMSSNNAGERQLESSEQATEHLRELRAFAIDAGLSADSMLQLITVITAPSTRKFCVYFLS